MSCPPFVHAFCSCFLQPSEETTEAATPADSEPPKSPSWVPSYSVSSQGASPLHSPNVEAVALPEETSTTVEPQEAEPAAITEPAEDVAEAAPVVEAVNADIVVEDAPVVEEEAISEAPVEPTEAAPAEVPIIATEEVEAPEVRGSLLSWCSR